MFLFFSVGPLESARQFLTKVLIRFSSELCKLKDQLKTSGFCTGCRILERALLPASQQFTHLFSISGALLSFQKIWVSLWFHFPSALRTLLSFSHNAGWLLTTSPSDDISISPSFLKDIFAGDNISGCQLLSLILALQTCSTGFWFLLILWELHGNLGHLGHYSPGLFSSVQFSSVTQSCPTLCNPMDCSMPGLPVHHQLPEFAQTHVHWIGDAIQHLILCHPLLLPSIFYNIRVFSNESALRIRWPKYWSCSFNISPSNEHQDWSPLGWTGWISLQSKGLSRVFSNTTVQKYQFFCAQLSL